MIITVLISHNWAVIYWFSLWYQSQLTFCLFNLINCGRRILLSRLNSPDPLCTGEELSDPFCSIMCYKKISIVSTMKVLTVEFKNCYYSKSNCNRIRKCRKAGRVFLNRKSHSNSSEPVKIRTLTCSYYSCFGDYSHLACCYNL